MGQYFASVITAIIVAVVSAYVTVRLSIKQFRSERWWELKVDAYRMVIEALHHIKKYCQEQRELMVRSKDDPEREKIVEDMRRNARDEIAKRRDIGCFIISEKAVQHLDRFEREFKDARKAEGFEEYLDMVEKAADDCLKELRVTAKQDLSIGERNTG